MPEIPAEKIPRKNRREAFQSDFLDRMFNEVNLFSGEEERNTWKDFFQSDFDFFFRFNVATDFLKEKTTKLKNWQILASFFASFSTQQQTLTQIQTQVAWTRVARDDHFADRPTS